MSAAEVLSTAPAASMEDIAAAAGISRATLFRRYPNRQVLVSAVARAAAEAYVTAIDAARLEDGPPDVALRRLIAALAPLGVRFGLLTSQPLDELVEQELLALVHDSDEQTARTGPPRPGGRRLSRRPHAEWVVIMVTWLLVGGADGVRLGTTRRTRGRAPRGRDGPRRTETTTQTSLTGSPAPCCAAGVVPRDGSAWPMQVATPTVPGAPHGAGPAGPNDVPKAAFKDTLPGCTTSSEDRPKRVGGRPHSATGGQPPRLSGVAMHSLRHFYASLLIRHGESVKTVHARLGHASAAETLHTYSHLWPDSEDRTRAAVDSVFGRVADSVRTDAAH